MGSLCNYDPLYTFNNCEILSKPMETNAIWRMGQILSRFQQFAMIAHKILPQVFYEK